MTAMAEQRFTSKTFLLFSGLLIWAAHFMFVYSANAVACERGLQDVRVLGIGLIPLTVMVATLRGASREHVADCHWLAGAAPWRAAR